MVVFNLALALKACFKKRKKSDFYRLARRRKEDVKKSVLDLLDRKKVLFAIFGFINRLFLFAKFLGKVKKKLNNR